ncbi:MAG: hybrid sensor histidine kinase/response regulator, partial [Candidatus Omnitrophica bacterium]|nr:hybrid sensor histidine kinase/response regulator [Candidatus Omnitrophota bacterium]
ISEASPVPVYGIVNMYLGEGIVGGKLLASQEHGRAAAELLIRVLNGEAAPQDVGVQAQSINRYLFDASELERWKIPRSRLPEGSTLINERYSVFREYRKYILWGAGLILGQMVLILALVTTHVKCRMAEKSVRENEERLR